MPNIKKPATVKRIVNHFGFEQITGDSESLKRSIITAEISRPGFELAGYFKHSDMNRTVIFGEKESVYIEQLSPEIQRERFDALTSDITPCIIICKGFGCPEELKKIAQEKNFPVLLTTIPTGRVSIALQGYLDEYLAEETLMHGVFMSIYGKGVIIKGDSGIGKSEIALELIKHGHLLVADDAVELYHVGPSIIGKSPYVLQNLLEIRGIGVIDVMKMYGVTACLDRATVDYIIQLDRWMPSKEYTRIGTEDVEMTEEILGVKIPLSIIPVTGGRSMAAVIEAAVMNIRLKELGHDSSKEFINRILDNINRQGQED